MDRALSYIKPYRKQIAVAFFFMLVELSVELLQPLFISKIIDHGIVARNMGAVIKWGAVMIALALLAFLSGISNSFFSSYVSQYYAVTCACYCMKKSSHFLTRICTSFGHLRS
ncbi:hypothetical protein BpPP18_20040 [Weizmannia acidilactici]|nr:hypothetical protein BpPP18_20040 [Weizmannia acidilactici]